MVFKYGLIAEKVTSDKSGAKSIVGVFNEIHSQRFPCQHPVLTVIAGIEANALEVGQHQLELCFVDADYRPLGRPFNKGFTVGEGSRFLDITVTVRDLILPRPGSYEFSVKVDDVHLGSVPLSAAGS